MLNNGIHFSFFVFLNFLIVISVQDLRKVLRREETPTDTELFFFFLPLWVPYFYFSPYMIYAMLAL